MKWMRAARAASNPPLLGAVDAPPNAPASPPAKVVACDCPANRPGVDAESLTAEARRSRAMPDERAFTFTTTKARVGVSTHGTVIVAGPVPSGSLRRT